MWAGCVWCNTFHGRIPFTEPRPTLAQCFFWCGSSVAPKRYSGMSDFRISYFLGYRLQTISSLDSARNNISAPSGRMYKIYSASIPTQIERTADQTFGRAYFSRIWRSIHQKIPPQIAKPPIAISENAGSIRFRDLNSISTIVYFSDGWVYFMIYGPLTNCIRDFPGNSTDLRPGHPQVSMGLDMKRRSQ